VDDFGVKTAPKDRGTRTMPELGNPVHLSESVGLLTGLDQLRLTRGAGVGTNIVVAGRIEWAKSPPLRTSQGERESRSQGEGR